MKPGNILFDEYANPFLSDFGIAKALESREPTLTETGQPVGSALYMAPEQAKGRVGVRSDQYALAATVYEVLTGRPPVQGDTVVEVLMRKTSEDPVHVSDRDRGVSRAAGDAVMRALARDPEERFDSCHLFASTLLERLTGKPAATTIAPPPVAGNAAVPLLLPYLCNRDAQKRRLAKFLLACQEAEFATPAVCMIEGSEYQALDKFLDCLRHLRLFQALGAGTQHEARVSEIQLRWPRSRQAAEVPDEITMNLGQEACGRLESTKSDVVRALGLRTETLLVTTRLPTEDWTSSSASVLDAFLRYWSEWEHAPRSRPILVVLSVKYRQGGGGWGRARRVRQRNRRIHDALAAAEAVHAREAPVVLLPELDDVLRSDVEEWIAEERVRRHLRDVDLTPEIRSLFEGRDRLAMESLAPKLGELISRHGKVSA